MKDVSELLFISDELTFKQKNPGNERVLNTDDQFLVEQTKSGCLEAFGLLVKRYQRKVYQIAYHFTFNVDDASDLSQEIFLKAYRSINKFNGLSTFYTWLYRIVYNSGIDYIRKQKKKSVYLFKDEFPNDESGLHPHTTSSTVAKLAEAEEIDNQIKQALDQLSVQQKQVFILRYYQHLPHKEIGELMKIKTGTVKAHLFNAIRNLRKHLSDYMEVE